MFTYYDFTGSAMSTLLDILAYNSTLYGYYANMIANESFLDTAQREESIYSLVKPLSYLPTSKRGARAEVVMNGTGTVQPGDLVVGGGLKWTPIRSYAVSGDTVVELYQGQQIDTVIDTYDATIQHQKFEIPSSDVDTNTLRVFVDNGNGQTDEYLNISNLSGNIAGVTGESKVYFLTTSTSGNYAVYFGDDFVGKPPNDQAVIRFRYFETTGAEGNNIASFTSSISGINVVTTIVPGVGGTDRETIESVRTNAPLYYQAQDRFVTAQDYLVGLRQSTSGVLANVWGGEENDPPNYGRVYVSAIGSDGALLTGGQKQNILSVMKSKGVVTILPTFVDPTPIDIVISGNVFYDPTRSPSTLDVVTQEITSYINSYQVNAFDTAFNFPVFSLGLTSIDEGIIGDTLEVFLRKEIPEGTISDTITLRNSLQRTNLPGVVRSTNFIANVDGTFPLVYIFDDGRGIMKMFNADAGTFIRDVGSVSYENGRIQLNDIQNTTDFSLSARTRSNTVLAIGSTLLTTRVGDIEILTS